jgi:hypothetical protein
MTMGVNRRGSRLRAVIPLAIMSALLVFWGFTARWTTFRCEREVCSYDERRALTFPFLRRIVLDRAVVAAHPERLRVEVYDSNHGGADLIIETDHGKVRLDEGATATMNARADELRAAFRGSAIIDASVSPHPFGLLVMGVLSVIVVVGVKGVVS